MSVNNTCSQYCRSSFSHYSYCEWRQTCVTRKFRATWWMGCLYVDVGGTTLHNNSCIADTCGRSFDGPIFFKIRNFSGLFGVGGRIWVQQQWQVAERINYHWLLSSPTYCLPLESLLVFVYVCLVGCKKEDQRHGRHTGYSVRSRS